MIATTTALSSARSFVACNVYVSAGRARYADALLSLLRRTQDQCRALRREAAGDDGDGGWSLSEVAVVHAFSDGPYDRSSFHLAGRVDAVASTASSLATDAMTTLRPLRESSLDDDDDGTLHPYVGLVDHVSIMPLLHGDGVGVGATGDDAGSAARAVADAMGALGCEVHLYGDARPDRAPLAEVRRERTSFFRSGGLSSSDADDAAAAGRGYGAATVGAPPRFVENFNVRMRCGRPEAVRLARTLREVDGPDGRGTGTGLPGVEALTLPYSDGRFEVACNMLRPLEAGAAEIAARCEGFPVESAYRVGTTEEQCWGVLTGGAQGGERSRKAEEAEAYLNRHDEEVKARLIDYLGV